MSQQTLDRRSQLSDRGQPNKRSVTVAALVAATIALVVNTGLVLVAAADRSWGALGILIMVGPITNGVMALASLAFIPLVRRLAAGAPIGPYVLTGTLLPIGAIIVDGICILSMELHGC
jgi:hypothetical protein